MKSLKSRPFQCMILLLLPLCMAQTCRPIGGAKSGDPNRFGIYTSTLDGKSMKPIINDSYREMFNARVSPDKKWVCFTRCNNVRRGIAAGLEYKNTEIMIIRLDGTNLESLTPPRKDIVSVNSYWAPDGKSIIYMSSDNPQKRVRINRMDLATHKTTPISPAEFLWASDPHQVGDQIVFPAVTNPKEFIPSIRIMKSGESKAKQLTQPVIPEKAKKLRPPPGDSDPKLSPDGSKVAFTRHLGKADFHTIVFDIKTGQEKDLTESVMCDVMPEWSSDGKLLVFWHADPKKPSNSGLYTIRADGSERKKIPLPPGYFYQYPAFFPGEGSGKETRIIFCAIKIP